MICKKCGTEFAEGIFCPECGTRNEEIETASKMQLENDQGNQKVEPASADSGSEHIRNISPNMPKKTKSKKMPMIIGIVILLIMVAIFIAVNWEGKIDYAATVGAHASFNIQGLPYTYDEVTSKYIASPEWKVRKDGDTHFVDINGIAKGSDSKLTITIKIESNPDDPNGVLINPESVTIDNDLTLMDNDAVEFLLAMFSAYDENYSDLSILLSFIKLLESKGKIDLSETYTDDAEGISFKYPNVWMPASELEEEDDLGIAVVGLANTLIPFQSLILVSKFPNHPLAEYLFIDDREFAENFSDDVSVMETSVEELNGITVRKIFYIDSEHSYVQSYFYTVGTDMYRVDLACSEYQTEKFERIFDAVMDSYVVTLVQDEGGMGNTFDVGMDEAYRVAYIEKIYELVAEDDTTQFSLINLTGSNIPELVAEHHGYDISVFLWVDGEVITLMDQWPCGVGGNQGYEYLPGNNVIRNYNMDYAGAAVYEYCMTVNDAYEIIPVDEGFSIRYFRDTNENGWPDDDEYSEEPIYYYGDTEISEEVYLSLHISGDFEWITGDLSAKEILAQLEGTDISSDYVSEGTMMKYYEPIENYSRLSGFYVGNREQSTLSLSIYTSQEEGEIEIGTVDINVNNEQYYFSAIIPVEENVYKVETDTGEEVLLMEAVFDDVVVLRLYVDGQYVEEYWMEEHYEP